MSFPCLFCEEKAHVSCVILQLSFYTWCVNSLEGWRPRVLPRLLMFGNAIFSRDSLLVGAIKKLI